VSGFFFLTIIRGLIDGVDFSLTALIGNVIQEKQNVGLVRIGQGQTDTDHFSAALKRGVEIRRGSAEQCAAIFLWF